MFIFWLKNANLSKFTFFLKNWSRDLLWRHKTIFLVFAQLGIWSVMFTLNSNGVTRQQNAWIYEIIQIQNEISQLIFEILDKIYQLSTSF